MPRKCRTEQPREWGNVPNLENAPDDLLLSPREAAALSGIAEVTFYVWRKQNRGPKWLLIEGMPRLRLGEYREWLAAQPRG
ncbi:MAG TPA: hypothetical protein VIU82_25175 [Bosea sp. (in: a-proteobacteria)]